MTRTCSSCSDLKPLGHRNKSGLCRPCLARRNFGGDEVKARAREGQRRFFADPVNRAAYRERSSNQLAKWRATPEGRDQVRAQAQANLVLAIAPEARERRIHGIRSAAWKGIPESRWDEATKLSKSFGSAEAKRMIMEDEAKRERDRLAAMTPFERQLERVRNGARVVDKVDTRKAAHDFTLGGIATGMI